MKKLSLRLEELAVESFDTAGPEPRRGTVQAYDSYDSPGYTGCKLSCAYPCDESDACTPGCPGGGSGGCGGGGTYEQSCGTGCRLSCAYPC
jgi:hypothetical protein